MNDFSIAITKNDVTKFRGLYKKQFGIELDEETATKKLNLLLVQLYRVYQPIKADQLEQLKNENENRNEKARPNTK